MTSLKRDLFERRLWPLAIVLVAAIVAVPFLLHKHHAQTSIAPPPPSKAEPGSSVTVKAKHVRKVTHAAHRTPTSQSRDPFAQAVADELGSSSDRRSSPSTASTTAGTASSAAGSPAAASSTAGGPGTPSDSEGATASAPTSTPATTTVQTTPVVTAPATTTSSTTSPSTTTAPESTPSTTSKATRFRATIYSTDVRVGAPGSPSSRRDIALYTPLPSDRAPQAMFLGLTDRDREAVFAIASGVKVSGLGGRSSGGAFCAPTRADCAMVVVPAGAWIDLTTDTSTGSEQVLVLRLMRIRSGVTHSHAVFEKALAHTSHAGFCDLEIGDPLAVVDALGGMVKIPSSAACRRNPEVVPFLDSPGTGATTP